MVKVIAKAKPKARPQPTVRRVRKRIQKRSRDGVEPQHDSMQIFSAPAAVGHVYQSRIPLMANRSDGSVIVTHREFVTNVFSGGAPFTVTTYPINPGIPQTFPWLSVIANRFDQYKIIRMCVEYVANSPTTVSGSVMAFFDMDASDEAPTGETQFLNSQRATVSVPWKDWKALIPDRTKGVVKYTRNSVVANTDIKTYDIANLFVATSGQAATTALGKLYVDYTIELLVPQIGVQFASGQLVTVAGATPAAPWTNAIATGNIPLAANPNNAGIIVFPAVPGNYYFVAVDWDGTTGQTSSGLSFNAFSNATANQIGVVSTTQSTTGSTSFGVWQILSVVSGATGVNAGLNGFVLFNVTLTATTLSTNGGTVTVSPWQTGLAFF